MKPILPLFIMIDACGWEIIRDKPFAHSFAPYRRRLTSVLGYSSTCIPTILTGRWPNEHRNWCYFVYDPPGSPFGDLRQWRRLPRALTSRRLFRRWLARRVKRKLGFRGYFDLYNIPFDHIHLFDFTEKKSPLQPNGVNCGPNIFDDLEDRGISYWVSDPNQREEENLHGLMTEIAAETIDFAFQYWPALDGILHDRGNQAPEVTAQLGVYEAWITQLLDLASRHYEEVHLYVFGDHGMANCSELLDLQSIIQQLPVRAPWEYAAVYDSTMARFWFFNENARRQITRALEQVPQGRILSDTELASLHVDFPDGYFGELFFLVREGVLIVPSHMGERPLRAMHGYHPDEKHSYAALLSNRQDIPQHIDDLRGLFELMTHEADQIPNYKTTGRQRLKPRVEPATLERPMRL